MYRQSGVTAFSKAVDPGIFPNIGAVATSLAQFKRIDVRGGSVFEQNARPNAQTLWSKMLENRRTTSRQMPSGIPGDLRP